MSDYVATSGTDEEENMATPRTGWTRPVTIIAIALLGASTVFTAGCGSSGDGGSSVTITSPSSASPTQADGQAFVEKAVVFAGEKGKDPALATFTAPEPLILHVLGAFSERFKDDAGAIRYEVDFASGKTLVVEDRPGDQV